ncbi:MAG: hypothetical protein EWV83_24680 [Microcystis sp. M_OC_Ca_00000000_S217Cul]|uniref:hypothetical protein n=1 Tax=unclassified Microcystis TaxID=2643300 RepID=UPI001193C023|nr:MAG: hypothetical protein EWV83_24680 [Microcystis sp. M_OC_Ca_00000000_S217Cul]TRT83934.1 MAG: hypothetical protein EWV66_21670 [Microcystis sp. M_OC_Ca_00000000_C217Col]
MANAIEKKTKRETIPRLVKLGLTPEQIAEALDLLVPEVKKIRLFWFSCVNFCYELKQANSLSRRCSKLVNP